MKIEHISSSQNPKIKLIHELYETKGRKKHSLFIAEGFREISMAYYSDYELVYIFINENFIQKKDIEKFPFKDRIFYLIDNELFSKISYRENTEGIIAIFKTKTHKLEDINLSNNPYIIVLEAIEKPGNIGAILRTADAVKADAVIISNSIVDIYNPNAIRASIGCIFTVPIAVCNNEEAISWLKRNSINIYCAALENAKIYTSEDFTMPTAIVFGTESKGLTKTWLENSKSIIKIPMLGKIDSLNVSNSVAIISYEVLRQRNFKA